MKMKTTPPPKKGISLSWEPLKSLGKKGRTLKKRGNSLQQKKQGNQKKQGKEDQGDFEGANSIQNDKIILGELIAFAEIRKQAEYGFGEHGFKHRTQ